VAADDRPWRQRYNEVLDMGCNSPQFHHSDRRSIDMLWAPHLRWAIPLGGIGEPIWNMTQGPTAVVLAGIWIVGTLGMLMRLISRIRREPRETEITAGLKEHAVAGFVADGIPVTFGAGHPTPAVSGIIYSRVSLPIGIDRLLDERELNAVLLHELTHARRRDNLIRLLYEGALCALWFHPLMWFSSGRALPSAFPWMCNRRRLARRIV
jgi:beta-lactamase regulating signal transducer with metallopeptidase domain